MTELTEKSIDRRTIVKGAAWSVPVLAVAVAAPAATASVTNSSLAWTATDSNLLELNVLDEGGTATADFALTVPSIFTLTNGPGAISQNATVTIAVGQPTGVNLAVGTARGFGVYSYDGAPVPSAERSFTYPLVVVGFPNTTWTGVRNVSVASNGTLNVPVVFGLAGLKDHVLDISLLATFPVTLTVDFGGGNSYTANANISVPASAGVL